MQKRPFSLQPKLDQADSNTHCHFFDRPVKYLIEQFGWHIIKRED